jgi:YHS domain-containing protein
MSGTHRESPVSGPIDIVGATILDPICDMTVDLEEQRGRGLTSDHVGSTYAFCSAGCKRSFDDVPAPYVAKVAAWEASQPQR